MDDALIIVPEDIKFVKINDTFNPNSIDCTEGEEDKKEDHQGLQDFLCNYALSDQEQNLSVTYLATYETRVLGYCTIAVTTLPFDSVPETFDKRAITREEIKKYPVLLIANFATDRKSREIHGIGSEMLRHCVGLGILLSEIVGCRYVILYATTAEKFYSENNRTEYKFKVLRENKDTGLKLMAHRIHVKKERHISEKIPRGESLSMKIKRVGEKEFHEP